MTVTHKLFKIFRGHVFCIKCYCDLWPNDLKIYRCHLLSMTNLSTKYHDCHSETFQDIEQAWFLHKNATVTLTFDLLNSKFIGVIYWPWPIYLPSTMTVTQKLFKILSGHDVANGRTDECHTIIRPKWQRFKIIKKYILFIGQIVTLYM